MTIPHHFMTQSRYKVWSTTELPNLSESRLGWAVRASAASPVGRKLSAIEPNRWLDWIMHSLNSLPLYVLNALCNMIYIGDARASFFGLWPKLRKLLSVNIWTMLCEPRRRLLVNVCHDNFLNCRVLFVFFFCIFRSIMRKDSCVVLAESLVPFLLCCK